MGAQLPAPSNKQTSVNATLYRLAWFVSWVPLSMVVVYLLARWNLGIEWWLVAKVLGWSWFWLLGPVQLVLTTKTKSVPVELVVAIGVVLLASIGHLGNESLALGQWVLPALGFVGWFSATRHWLPKMTHQEWISVPWLLWLGSWLAMRVWGSQYLSPLFRENVMTMAAHPDTLFHLAIANMIKTYGVVTTGLDGLVPLPYHAGSHWLLAGWSWWLAEPVIETYNVLYPLIWLPLLMLVCWWLSVRIALRWSFISSISDGSWLTWLVFVSWMGWVLPWPLSWQNHWQLETVVMFSESFTIGLVLSGLIAGWWLSSRLTDTRLWLWLLASIGLWLFVGWVKISFLYFGLLVCWWWLIRYWRVTTQKQWLAALVASVMAVVLYRATSLPDHEPVIKWGAFWLVKLEPSWRLSWWLAAMSGWLIATLAWWRLPHRLARLASWEYQVAGLVVLAGLVPAFWLLMPGGNEVYFIEVQRWWGVALLGAGCLKVCSHLTSLPLKTWQKIGGGVIGLAMVAGVSLNYLWATKIFVQQISSRQARFRQLYGRPNAEFGPVLTWLQQVSQQPRSQKRVTALSIPRTSRYWQLSNRCDAVSLIAPAWTGVQLVNGLPGEGCARLLFGHRMYPVESKAPATIKLQSP